MPGKADAVVRVPARLWAGWCSKGSPLILVLRFARAVPAALRGAARYRPDAPASLQCTMRENDAPARTGFALRQSNARRSWIANERA